MAYPGENNHQEVLFQYLHTKHILRTQNTVTQWHTEASVSQLGSMPARVVSAAHQIKQQPKVPATRAAFTGTAYAKPTERAHAWCYLLTYEATEILTLVIKESPDIDFPKRRPLTWRRMGCPPLERAALRAEPSQDKCFHVGNGEELGNETFLVLHTNSLAVKGSSYRRWGQRRFPLLPPAHPDKRGSTGPTWKCKSSEAAFWGAEKAPALPVSHNNVDLKEKPGEGALTTYCFPQVLQLANIP